MFVVSLVKEIRLFISISKAVSRNALLGPDLLRETPCCNFDFVLFNVINVLGDQLCCLFSHRIWECNWIDIQRVICHGVFIYRIGQQL